VKVVGISFVAQTRRKRLNQKINRKKIHKNKKRWKSKKEAAKGPSFLNQKTVLTLWYEKWSFLAEPHPHLDGSWLSCI